MVKPPMDHVGLRSEHLQMVLEDWSMLVEVFGAVMSAVMRRTPH